MVESSQEVHARRIRGGYRRRILDHLSDGSATVSEVANAVTLRLPHASSELKRLRQEGLVASDAEAGQRGARQHLTVNGWRVLAGDELMRLQELEITSIPSGAVGCLLARDGPQLLIAYANQHDSPLIPLPQAPRIGGWGGDEDSTGREGVMREWTWAVTRESSPRWYSIPELSPVSGGPSAVEQESLEAWTEPVERIGLVRARLLDKSQSLRLAIGTWFGQPPEGNWPSLPTPVGSSEGWRLGEAHPDVPPIRPAGPICAVLPDRLSASMLLTGSADSALVVAEATLLGRIGDAMPLGALTAWVERAHPRLSVAERQRRLDGLVSAIRKGRRKRSGTTRVEESTWRKFSSDWGEQEWRDSEGDEGEILDVQGISDTAWLSLLDWSLTRPSSSPVVLQYPRREVDHQVLQTLLSDPRTRLVLLASEPNEIIGHPTLRPDPVQPLPWVRLQLAGDVSLPIRLSQRPPSTTLSIPSGWIPPDSAAQLVEFVEHSGFSDGDAPQLGEDASEEMQLFAAIARYPNGDSDWADRIESQSKLAAWIASPAEERWSRWRRIGDDLGSEWLGLMSVDSVPVEAVASVAAKADDEWQERAHNSICGRLRVEPDLALRLRPLVDGGTLSIAAVAWLSGVLLASVSWLGDALADDLSRWSAQRLAESPPANLIPAILGLQWLEQRGLQKGDWSESLRLRASTKSGQFAAWAALLSAYQSNSLLSRSALPAALELPIDWWAPNSEALFNILNEDSEGREILLRLEVPWAAAILRPSGEMCIVAGAGSIEHSGCSTKLLERLERLLTSASQIEDDEHPLDGLAGLFDLRDALRCAAEGIPPRAGRCHEHVGWLAQPIEHWPHFSAAELTSGSAHITTRLAARISGWHEGLVGHSQRRL